MRRPQHSRRRGSRRTSSAPGWLRTLVRAILRLYPEDARGIRREEMEETFFDRYRNEMAARSRLPFIVRESFSLAGLALSERIRVAVRYRPAAGVADDVRFAIRALSKHRLFALGAIVMLALGIGVNTAVFSMASGMAQVVNRFDDPDRLVFVWGVEHGWDEGPVPMDNLSAWQEQATAFEDIGFYTHTYRYLTGSGDPLRLREAQTSPNLFPMLGLDAELGRLFGPGDARPSAPPVVVITHRLWQERYGGDADIVGRTMLLNEVPHTVIGVLPAKVEFELLWRGVSVFAPLMISDAAAGQDQAAVNVIGRLTEGAAVNQAQAQLTVIAARSATTRSEANDQNRVFVQPFKDFFLAPDDKLAMVGMLLAVAAVLLIACVNLANLLLAKGATRQGEMAVRMAIGATPGRVVRQLLSESLLLALLGGTGGIVLGQWGLYLLLSSLRSTPFQPEEVGLNPALFVYALSVSVVAALAFGLTPALLASRVSLGESLKVSGAGASSGKKRKRLRSGLLVGQLALTVPLVLTCAVSFLNLRALQQTDLGFPVDGLMSVQVSLPTYRYEEPAQQARFYREAVESVRGIPGVTQASAGPSLPIGPGAGTLYGPLLVEGREDMEGRARGPSGYTSVLTGYFQTLGAPLRRGRFFSDRDAIGSPPVAIVNEAFAHLYWPDQDPVGRRLMPETDPARLFSDYPFAQAGPITVVGVVADVGTTFHGEPPAAALYLSLNQFPTISAALLIRTSTDGGTMAPAIRRAIASVDAGVPATDFQTGEGAVAAWLRESKSIGASLGVMGALALGMAMLGLYGMVAHSVAQRTFELGLRAVLGANRAAILSSVMRSFVGLAGIGVVIGTVIAVALGVIARSFLVLLRVSYLPTVLGVVGLLMGVVIVAAYLPARQAIRIEPVIALKHE